MFYKNKDSYRITNDEDYIPPDSNCISVTVVVNVPTTLTFNYMNCENKLIVVGWEQGSRTICCMSAPTTSAASSKYSIFFNGEC